MEKIYSGIIWLNFTSEEQRKVSASQSSFDLKVEYFDKLIDLLETVPEYSPNKDDLKIIALKTLYTGLNAGNTAVIEANTALSNARIARNSALYKDLTGMIDLALDVKSYVKSVYGARSQEYKQVAKLLFKSYKVA